MAIKKGDFMPYHDRDWLYEQYVVQNRTIASIATEFDVAHQTIEKFLKRYQITKRVRVDLPPASEICSMYINDGLTAGKIADMYPGTGIVTINKILDENNVERIPANERTRQWWSDSNNKNRMRELRADLWNDEEYRTKTLANRPKGEARELISRMASAKYQGVSLDEWQGYLTPEQSRIRGSKEYLDWRVSVFKRDDYRCQCCGDKSHAGHPVTLHAHHLENFAHNENLRFDIDNGITLCKNCHDIRVDGSFHNLYGIHNNTRTQFEEFLARRRS